MRMKKTSYNEFFSGYILFNDQQDKQFIEIELPQFPKRKPEESNTEISFRGPRDGFTEDVEENIALVRKRLRTSSLVNESYIVGKRGQVQLSLLYMKDIVRDEILNEVRKQIEAIDTDAVLSLAEVEERLTNTKFTFFSVNGLFKSTRLYFFLFGQWARGYIDRWFSRWNYCTC